MNRNIKINLVLILFLSIIFPTFVFAQVVAGFVDKPIWFSNEPDTVGETTNISTLINNQDSKAIYGVVGFYDNGSQIGEKTTTVSASASKVITISWKVSAGSHSIVVKFENTKSVSDKGVATKITNEQTSAYRFTVLTKEEATLKTDDAKSITTLASDPIKSSVGGAISGAKELAQNTFEAIDNFRDDTSVTLEKSVIVSEKEIEVINKEKVDGKVAGASAKKESFLKTPLAILKQYFFKFAHFIFAQTWTFYGLIILIIILFVRYLIRAPR